MITNYLLTFFRNFKRDAVFVLINLAGLAAGLACCIILGLYLWHELTYDHHFTSHENIYRLVGERNLDGNSSVSAQVHDLLGTDLERDFNDVRAHVTFTPLDNSLFRQNDTAFYWDHVYAADANVFAVFTHTILAGDPQTALAEPSSMAISESFAQAYFGAENPVGKVLKGVSEDHVVRLVFADLPSNTHLRYDALLYRASIDAADPVYAVDLAKGGRLLQNTDYTYVVMPPAYNPADFSTISTQFTARYLNESAPQFRASMRYYLEALTDIHYRSVAGQDLPRGNLFYLLSFIAVTVLALVVACMNYINLATARFTWRTREAGVRLALGADRPAIFRQFMYESVFMALTALPFALLLVAILQEQLPHLAIIEKLPTVQAMLNPRYLLMMLAGTTLIGAVTGLYPAWVLSRSSLAKRNSPTVSNRKGMHVRQGLVLMQLTISICVIACTLLMVRQIRFLQDVPLGFNPANKIVVALKGPSNIDRLPALLTELEQYSNVSSAAYAENMPGNVVDIVSVSAETNAGEVQRQTVGRDYVHDQYVETMGLEIVLGRDFNPTDYAVVDFDGSPDRIVLVNEAFVKAMQWQEPLGKSIGTYRVVGVVRDFKFQGLQQQVERLVIQMDKPRWNRKTPDELAAQVRYLIVAYTGDAALAVLRLREEWQKHYPELPFEYVFLDDYLASLHASDEAQLEVLGLFGSLCIMMASLGLFALTAFTTEQRRHEIAIRKIMGAGARDLMVLLFVNLLRLIVIAGLIASCCSWWIVSTWLQGFSYQQDINLLMFFLATAAMGMLAFLTHLAQTWRMSRGSPVGDLRYE